MGDFKLAHSGGNHFSIYSAVLAALLFSGSLASAAVYRVKPNGDDTKDGSSWLLAKRTVANGLAAARSGDQVWVAAGMYLEKVMVPAGVELYGGFAGTETALAQRNWVTNLSVLNLYVTNGPLVTISNAGPNTRLDGMVLTGGSAEAGAGLYLFGSGAVVANNRIYLNAAYSVGAGVLVQSNYFAGGQHYDAILTNNVIARNYGIADNSSGGGIAVLGASPLIAWNVIARNSVGLNGGGVAVFCTGLYPDACPSFPRIANNYIVANTASRAESGLGSGGGIFAAGTYPDGGEVLMVPCAPVIVNNVIAANGSQYGAGVGLDLSRSGEASVVNNTIVANSGAGICWRGTSPTNCNNLVAYNWAGFLQATNALLLANNNVYGNSLAGQNSDYLGLPNQTGLHGNISAEPRLANYKLGNLHLQPGSPCINAGMNGLTSTNEPDLDGQPRVLNGAIDIGAYEATGADWQLPTRVIRVAPSGNDNADGLSWASAKKTVQAGIDAAANYISGGEVWVAQGTYPEHVTISALAYVYGGFAGTETNRAARNPGAHPTILDGGGTPPVVSFENAGYLVCTLDGFTVQNGGVFTDGSVDPLPVAFPECGGGIRCRVGSPIIANNLIRWNSVGSPQVILGGGDAEGAGIYGYLCHALITGNTLTQNEVLNTYGGNHGGGLAFHFSLPIIEGNQISDNRAEEGPAIYADFSSEPTIRRNFISSNWFYEVIWTYDGCSHGAITLKGCPYLLLEGNTILGNTSSMDGAGISIWNASGGGVIQNNLLLSNSLPADSGLGAGLYCSLTDTPTGSMLILNNTFVGNVAGTGFADCGGAMNLTSISTSSNALIVANNIMAMNSSGIFFAGNPDRQTLRNNCLLNQAYDYGGSGSLQPGAGDIHLSPQFANLASGDFHLAAASPCVDAGTALYASASDLEGTARPLDGNNDGVGAPDLGAYEFVHALADTDHDGMPDQAEVLAGTSPTDPASVLKLLSRRLANGTGIGLSWSSVAGRTYGLQFRPSLTGSWQTLTSNIPGCGAPIEVQDRPLTNRFYRLQVQRP